MYRDFTYIDDIVEGMIRLLSKPPKPDEKGFMHRVYNIGNNKPEKLMDFIETLEYCIGKKAIKNYMPMQPGDVYQTYADIKDLMRDVGFKPQTPIKVGLQKFVDWYRENYNIDCH